MYAPTSKFSQNLCTQSVTENRQIRIERPPHEIDFECQPRGCIGHAEIRTKNRETRDVAEHTFTR